MKITSLHLTCHNDSQLGVSTWCHILVSDVMPLIRRQHVMGLFPDTYNWGLRMRRESRERFPRHRGLVIPTCITARACVTHVPWCMPGKRSRSIRSPQFYVSGKRPMSSVVAFVVMGKFCWRFRGLHTCSWHILSVRGYGESGQHHLNLVSDQMYLDEARMVESTFAGPILGLHPADERRRYFVTASLMGWVQA